MPELTDLDKYLAEVEERNGRADSDWDQLVALQADVEPLGQILECQRRIIAAKDKLLAAYRLGSLATPRNALDTIRDQAEVMDRIVRKAREKQPSTSTKK